MSRKIGEYSHVQCEGNAEKEDYRIFTKKQTTQRCKVDKQIRKCNALCHQCPYGLRKWSNQLDKEGYVKKE